MSAARGSVRVRLPAVLGAVLAALALSAVASAQELECPELTVAERLERADAAFVGRLLSSRPVGEGTGVEQRVYRFAVDLPVKGVEEGSVEIRAQALTDRNGDELIPDVAVGVLATRVGDELSTGSCGLLDPGALLAEADKPKGAPIKVVIGVVITALVVGYSLLRLRRRRDAEAGGGSAGAPGSAGPGPLE